MLPRLGRGHAGPELSFLPGWCGARAEGSRGWVPVPDAALKPTLLSPPGFLRNGDAWESESLEEKRCGAFSESEFACRKASPERGKRWFCPHRSLFCADDGWLWQSLQLHGASSGSHPRRPGWEEGKSSHAALQLPGSGWLGGEGAAGGLLQRTRARRTAAVASDRARRWEPCSLVPSPAPRGCWALGSLRRCPRSASGRAMPPAICSPR